MKTLTETLEVNLGAFGLWLSGVAHHLASFGACMIVFGVVYLIGRTVGDSAGSIRTESAFKECGEAHCWSDPMLIPETAP